jgi:hypothetical protein
LSEARRRSRELRAIGVVFWGLLFFGVLELATSLLLTARGPAGRFNRAGLDKAPTVTESVVEWQVRRLLDGGPPDDVAFFGDSSCLMGIVPGALSGSGIEAWNYGTIGWLSIDGYADLLHLYAERRGRPRLAVCYMSMYPLTVTPDEIERMGFREAFLDWVHPGRWEGSLADLPGALPSREIHLFFEPTAARLAGSAFLREARGPYPSDEGLRALLVDNRGYLPALVTRNLEAGGEARLDPQGPWIPSLKRLFKTADEGGIPLLLLLHPFPESGRSRPEARERDSWQRLVEVIAAPYRGVRVGSPLVRYLPRRLFATEAHLTPEGARVNTEELTPLLLGALGRAGEAADPGSAVPPPRSPQGSF